MFLPLEIARNLLMGLQSVARLAQRYQSTGVNSDPKKVREIFELYRRFQPVAGKDVLEIGPGHTLEVLEAALKAGATSCTAVDVIAYATQGLAKGKQIEYVIYDGRRLPFDSSRFDLIWSHTAFEHLRYPTLTLSECFRVLREGGSLVAFIDLGDHSYYGAKPPQPMKLFECMRYSEWLWDLMKWNRSSYTNRLRKSGWIKLFKETGFVVRHEESQKSASIADALPSLPYLHRFSHEDAVTNVVTVWLEKPL